MSERDWRLDEVNAAQAELEPESVVTAGWNVPPCDWFNQLLTWSKRAARRARSQAGPWIGFAAITRDEEIIHGHAELLERCNDTDAIEASFFDSVRRLTGASFGQVDCWSFPKSW